MIELAVSHHPPFVIRVEVAPGPVNASCEAEMAEACFGQLLLDTLWASVLLLAFAAVLLSSCLRDSIDEGLTSSCRFSAALASFSAASARNFAEASWAILRILSLDLPLFV